MTGDEKSVFSFNSASSFHTFDHFHQSFVDREVLFIHFSQLDEALAREVLAWRNHPEVRKWMYNKNVISEETHFQFLQLLPRQKQRYYWVVKEGDKNLGVIDLSNYQAGKSEWGFYLNPNLMGGGKALHLFHHALHFFFHKLQLQQVYGYVDCLNTDSLLLNELFDMHLSLLMPRKHAGEIHWYAKYELSQVGYLNKGLELHQLKKKLIRDRAKLRRKRQEIQLRQLLIEAFGRPALPWTRSVAGDAKEDSIAPKDKLRLGQFSHLLQAQFDCKLAMDDLLSCQQFSDVIRLLID